MGLTGGTGDPGEGWKERWPGEPPDCCSGPARPLPEWCLPHCPCSQSPAQPSTPSQSLPTIDTSPLSCRSPICLLTPLSPLPSGWGTLVPASLPCLASCHALDPGLLTCTGLTHPSTHRPVMNSPASPSPAVLPAPPSHSHQTSRSRPFYGGSALKSSLSL